MVNGVDAGESVGEGRFEALAGDERFERLPCDVAGAAMVTHASIRKNQASLLQTCNEEMEYNL